MSAFNDIDEAPPKRIPVEEALRRRWQEEALKPTPAEVALSRWYQSVCSGKFRSTLEGKSHAVNQLPNKPMIVDDDDDDGDDGDNGRDSDSDGDGGYDSRNGNDNDKNAYKDGKNAEGSENGSSSGLCSSGPVSCNHQETLGISDDKFMPRSLGSLLSGHLSLRVKQLDVRCETKTKVCLHA